MSTQTEITRLQTARNKIRTWLVGLGLAASTDKLDALADKAGTMPDNGAVEKVLDATTGNQEYTIPAGKHSGAGKVSVVLESKSATPAEAAQDITPTKGKVLGKVTVGAIPAKYKDVSGVTAGAADVLDGKFIVLADGSKVEGTMANNGAIAKTIDGLTQTSVSVPAGYTSGGTVSLTDAIETALATI